MMKSSNCISCKDYVSLEKEQLAAGDYCNKHLLWLHKVTDCATYDRKVKEIVEHPARGEGV